jgi:hypothetical protein
LAIRAETVVGVLAPEDAVVALLHGGVPFGIDELAVPVQVLATVHADVGHTVPLILYFAEGRREYGALHGDARKLHLVAILTERSGAFESRFADFGGHRLRDRLP